MSNTQKPNLYCFGDSFVQWPKPEGRHWTNLFENEYKVHRLGKNGAANEHIIFQLGNLPKYKNGDRVVIVLTDHIRLPKWTWGEYYGQFTESNPNRPEGRGENATDVSVRVLEDVMIRKSDLLRPLKNSDKALNEVKSNRHKADSPIELYNFIDNIDNLIGDFKPIIVTWSANTFELLKSKITPLPQGYWTSIDQEGIGEEGVVDYHPGVEGCKFWYKEVNKLLLK